MFHLKNPNGFWLGSRYVSQVPIVFPNTLIHISSVVAGGLENLAQICLETQACIFVCMHARIFKLIFEASWELKMFIDVQYNAII